MTAGSKIRTLDELALLRKQWAAEGKTVVWTNGCFDILHAGHVRSLCDAKNLGDILIVGLNSDASVRAIKGSTRPIIGQDDRAELLAALEAVDYVTIFDAPDPVAALSRIRPDIHCKGEEYASGDRPLPERETVLSYGGQIKFLPLHPGRSTSELIDRISRQAIHRFLDAAPSVRILVAGDVMLDAYVSGDAARISPEAPVPVVGVSHRRYVAGGAANVAANIRALGAGVSLAGVTGVDDSAVRLRAELDRAGINTDALIEDPDRPTTVKTRVTAAGQQIVRFDHEDRSPLSEFAYELLQRRCEHLLSTVDACVISDYAKGVMSDAFCRWLIDAAARHKKPVVVDPKSRDLTRYRGATIVTPNLRETEAAAREPIHNADDLARAAALLLRSIAPSALLITRGEEGMSLFDPVLGASHLPALVNEVADVTGAGDTVAASLAVALGAGLSLRDAVGVANIAAGIAVSHHGTWAVGAEELLKASVRLELAMEASQS